MPIKAVGVVHNSGCYGGEPEAEETVLPVATTAQIDPLGKFLVGQMPLRSFTEDEVRRYACKNGDILIVKSSGSADNIISGKAGLVDEGTPLFVFSNFLMRIQPELDKILPSYLYAFLVSHLTRQRVELMCSTTTYPNLQVGEYVSASITLPPRSEQKQIADFLDWKTGQIDALIAKKQQLIEKLQEQRITLITQAVTKGLNPNALMRESSIPWLGEVPDHWDVMQLRRRWEIYDCKHKTVSFIDEGFPAASIREVNGFEVDLTNANKTTEEEYEDMIEGGREPKAGDIIYSRNVTVGDAAIVTTEERFCMGQDVCLLRSVDAFSRFVAYSLRSHALREQAEAIMVGSTFKRVNVGQIKAFWIAVPPHSEQKQIAKFLDKESTKIDRMLGKVETAIERLSEYRTAIITAATTGKIDVRDVEIPLAV